MDEAREKFIKMFKSAKKAEENRKFGELILQSNEVQFYLYWLVVLNSSFPDEIYLKSLERMEFGNLINLFCACAKRHETIIIKKLREYKDKRNRLAHKMYTSKKLTKIECEKTIEDGKEILKIISIFLETKSPIFNKK